MLVCEKHYYVRQQGLSTVIWKEPMLEDQRHRKINDPRRLSLTDRIFDSLYRSVISLELLPGAKLSEAEVAKTFSVSRQPVRDAFYRLSERGFLEIRPQRASIVSKISERAVRQAVFIRTALEVESVRTACQTLSDEDIDRLAEILAQQKKVVKASDKMAFHQLDDLFHQEICERAGVGFIWRLIQDNKAHMDRVRFLSLSFATDRAYKDHDQVLEALRQRDADLAVKRMRSHLSTLMEHFPRIHEEYPIYFA